MKEPKTMKGKLSLLIKVCNLASEGCSDILEENRLINNVVALIQNELGKNDDILEKYGLKWKG